MSAQLLSRRTLNRIARAAGLPEPLVVRGWSHGGYWLGFVTWDHHHGVYNTKSREVVWWYSNTDHYTSCGELPPYQYGPPTLSTLRREGKSMMGLIFHRRVGERRTGRLRTWLNLSTGGVSGSAKLGRVTVNTRGRVTIRLWKGFSIRL
jgi:hypothetical protein